jgi:uncharacterized protein DUF5666
MRTKVVGLLSGVVLLLGAGSAYAATSAPLAPSDVGRGHPGDHGSMRRHVVIGKITDTNDHTFALAARWGDVKVRWDDDTIFRGGDKGDLDEGTIVGVLGERSRGTIDAKVIFFPRHDDHDKGHR